MEYKHASQKARISRPQAGSGSIRSSEMNAFYIILAACPVLFLGVAAFLVLIAVGVRKGDRSDLASPPGNRLDAITRRVVGVGTCSKEGDS